MNPQLSGVLLGYYFAESLFKRVTATLVGKSLRSAWWCRKNFKDKFIQSKSLLNQGQLGMFS
jgi:hypothetical protein